MNIPLRIACPLATCSVPLFSMDQRHSNSTAVLEGIEVIACRSGRQAISQLAAHKADIALATDEAFSSAIEHDTKLRHGQIVRLCDVSQGNVCFHVQSDSEISESKLWELLQNEDQDVAVVACPPETNYAGLVKRKMNVQVVHIENAHDSDLLRELLEKVKNVRPQLVLLIGLPNWIENVKTVLSSLAGKLKHKRDYSEAAQDGWLGTEEYGFYVNRDLLDGISNDSNGGHREIDRRAIFSRVRSILRVLNDLSNNEEDLKQLVSLLGTGIRSDIQATGGGSLSALMTATRTRVNLRPTRHILSCWENEVNA